MSSWLLRKLRYEAVASAVVVSLSGFFAPAICAQDSASTAGPTTKPQQIDSTLLIAAQTQLASTRGSLRAAQDSITRLLVAISQSPFPEPIGFNESSIAALGRRATISIRLPTLGRVRVLVREQNGNGQYDTIANTPFTSTRIDIPTVRAGTYNVLVEILKNRANSSEATGVRRGICSLAPARETSKCLSDGTMTFIVSDSNSPIIVADSVRPAPGGGSIRVQTTGARSLVRVVLKRFVGGREVFAWQSREDFPVDEFGRPTAPIGDFTTDQTVPFSGFSGGETYAVDVTAIAQDGTRAAPVQNVIFMMPKALAPLEMKGPLNLRIRPGIGVEIAWRVTTKPDSASVSIGYPALDGTLRETNSTKLLVNPSDSLSMSILVKDADLFAELQVNDSTVLPTTPTVTLRQFGRNGIQLTHQISAAIVFVESDVNLISDVTKRKQVSEWLKVVRTAKGGNFDAVKKKKIDWPALASTVFSVVAPILLTP